MKDYRTEAEALAAAKWSRGPHAPAGVIAPRGSSARSTSFACGVGPSAAAISTSTNRHPTWASRTPADGHRLEPV